MIKYGEGKVAIEEILDNHTKQLILINFILLQFSDNLSNSRRIRIDNTKESRSQIFHLLFLKNKMPSQRLKSEFAHIWWFLYHETKQFVCLSFIEKYEKEGCQMAYVFVVEILAFLFLQKGHKLCQNLVAFFIEKWSYDNFFKAGPFMPKKSQRLI